ncbi:hypothetical protein DdX_02869 [Ditylenchus destructor]|uniref:Uncharacterized protein n=1 Tax=Ditylenchus destructor TaxID=166010 RepID=A0AAD4NDL6_9BILA|nr:hypothetical protein DdX_02869 [Ditylenchus destructor]
MSNVFSSLMRAYLYCYISGGGGGGRKKRDVATGSGGVLFPRAIFPKPGSVSTLSEGCGSINCIACNDVAGGLRRRRRSIVENKFACSSGLLNSVPCKRAALANLKPESMSDRINPRFGFKAGFSCKC